MKLTELDQKNHAKKALKESFSVDLDVSKLDKSKTKTMLNKVSGLIKEAKASPDFYKNQTSPTYMKLVFMEQALKDHYANIPVYTPRIVVENEEVAKSQVILAAQDMIDTVQKMLEDINDMMVKELPALVNSIQNGVGVNESQEFNAKANEALEAINVTLQSSKSTLEGALGIVTGQGAPAFDAGAEDADLDTGPDMGGDDLDMGGDDLDMGGDDLDVDVETDDVALGPVGRAKR
jgi:hypothetical protein